MKHKILLVDDEPDLVETVRAYLHDAGYDVATAHNGQDAVFAARHEDPDLVVLDVMLPGLDGFEVLRRLRKESSVPVLMLTARVDDADKIVGLEIGADDYVTKPFNPRELVARIRALLRRTYGDLAEHDETLRVGGLELQPGSYQAALNGTPLDLTRSEFDLLRALMQAPGRVFTRMDLLEQLQGEAFAAYERTIDVHVKNLRAKIEDDPRQPRYIETVYGVGYRLVPDDE